MARNDKNHGYRKNDPTGTYKVWQGIKARCNNPNVQNYKWYGGRGIRVCERWSESFLAFLEDMGPRPSLGHSIDRIDGDRNYEPSNCRWIPGVEQNLNKKNNRLVTIDGRTQPLSVWSREVGIVYATLLYRLRRGWSEEEAIKTPLFPMGKRRLGQTYFGRKGVAT